MVLEQYRRKRDFGRTPEPAGLGQRAGYNLQYVIHLHDATRLHYDLRLELDGVLKSWAVPKGPSLDPDDKRLAVHVEDHPLEYASFEGVIPKGEYGGGPVMLWDRGIWEPVGDPLRAYRKGHLSFRLNGGKLKGRWTLARMHGETANEEEKNWLLIKKKDEAARRMDELDILAAEPLSIVSGRSLAEIAAGESIHQESPGETGAGPLPLRKQTGCPAGLFPADLPGARQTSFPAAIIPQMATLVDKPPTGDDWLHEVKYDGYRLFCLLEGGKVRLFTRNGHDWTERFPRIAAAAAGLSLEGSILDGEVVVLLADGTTDFQALQNILKGIQSGEMVYFIFDLPRCCGFDLSHTPLLMRKQFLESFLGAMAPGHQILRYSSHIQGNGDIVLEHACRLNLEGIVSKRVDSLYVQKRTRTWLKTKCLQRQEFVVGGFTDPGGSRFGFGALLLGYYDEQGRLIYAGRAGTGFNEQLLRQVSHQLRDRERSRPFFVNPPTGREARGVHWLAPELVAEIEFFGWTRENVLRHPSFKGLREDKGASEITLERAQKSEAIPGAGEIAGSVVGKRVKKMQGLQRVAGISLTNPERVFYPAAGITKEDLARFYQRIGEWILPHLSHRPLAMLRCPQGHEEECFYQKHLEEPLPAALRGVAIREKESTETYVYLEDAAGLITLVQLGVLEFHPWGSRVEMVERPDRMIFDLDPGQEVTGEEVVAGAVLLRKILADLGLESFVKTTGGKGLHVIVPLEPVNGWEEVKAFARAVAEKTMRHDPKKYLTTMSKAKRKGRIYLDYLRNSRGATAIAAYSTRARTGAPVATPLDWDELSPGLFLAGFNINNLPERLAGLKIDPWEKMISLRQSLTREMQRALEFQR